MRDYNLFQRFKPYPFDIDGVREVYGNINIDEVYWYGGDSVTCKLSISLLNNEMLNYDREILNSYENRSLENQKLSDEYQMFFYEFFSKTILSIDEYNYLILNSSWFKLKLYSEDAAKQTNEENLIEGEILFSASPIIKGKIYIKIICSDSGKRINHLYSSFDDKRYVYDLSKKATLYSKINKIFETSFSKIACSIYNVGQGNCIHIQIDEIGLFFDIGLTTKNEIDMTSIDIACDEIKKIESKAVILSHWDLDHILGITLKNPSVDNCLWVAPRFKNMPGNNISAIRMCAVLIHRGADFCLIDEDYENSLVYQTPKQEITIWKGKAVAKNDINPKNNYGLIMKIQGASSILLPGDCDYDVMKMNRDDIFKTAYTHVVVPHHGSVMGKADSALKTPAVTGHAYVSQGKVTGNFKPDHALTENYKKIKYEIKNTKLLTKCGKYLVDLK